jgi:hypothetical protein
MSEGDVDKDEKARELEARIAKDKIGRRSRGTHVIRNEVVIGVDDAHIYEVAPRQVLEDVATAMVLDFNANDGYGAGEVPPGYVFRIRVLAGEEGNYFKGHYSPLDRFLFDGEKAISLFRGDPDTKTVGRFSGIAAGHILMQIAGYGQVKKQKTKYENGAEVKDRPPSSDFGEWLTTPPDDGPHPEV